VIFGCPCGGPLTTERRRTLAVVNVVMLLGSGSSVHAGMPSVDEITQRVLSGESVTSIGGAYRVVERLPPN
jgi:hypothetical protein